jgi:hypothetical protein
MSHATGLYISHKMPAEVDLHYLKIDDGAPRLDHLKNYNNVLLIIIFNGLKHYLYAAY